MKFLKLITLNLLSYKLSLSMSAISVVLTFFLFGFLGSVKVALKAGTEMTAEDRLVVMNKVNFTLPLPLFYLEPIRSIEGVETVSYANWFGGYYKDPLNRINSMAVDHQSYFDVYDELLITDDVLKMWRSNKVGAVVGRQMAEIHGWQVGDIVSLSSNIYKKRTGGNIWDLEVVGYFDGKDKLVDTNSLLFRHDYFDLSHTYGEKSVGWYVVDTASRDKSYDVAKAIDALYINTPAETKTTTEKEFVKAFIEQMGDIGLIVTIVVSAAFFCILLIVGNTLMQRVRQRYVDFAVLSVMGYSKKLVFALILSEGLLQVFISGSLGLFLAWFALDGLNSMPEVRTILPNLVMNLDVLSEGVLYIILMGLIAGFIPAYNASRLNLLEVLGRG